MSIGALPEIAMGALPEIAMGALPEIAMGALPEIAMGALPEIAMGALRFMAAVIFEAVRWVFTSLPAAVRFLTFFADADFELLPVSDFFVIAI
jgi:hypothetical protein